MMNIIGQKVIHRAFGEGTVCQMQDRQITVQFSGGEKRFSYPAVFRQYLTATDAGIQQAILEEIELNRQQEQAQRAARLQTGRATAENPPQT